MRKPDHALLKLTRAMWLTVISFLLLALTFAWYVRAEKSIDVANEQRLQMLELAEELRQTSHALTTMVRTYVATGNPLYKKKFLLIVAVRDGRQPPPANYLKDPWIFGEDDGQVIPIASSGTPLLEKIRTVVSARAFGKLAQAKANSDTLIRIELEAMRLAEEGEGSVASRQQALALVFGPAYQQAKAGIMTPIGEFREMLERERQLVEYAAALEETNLALKNLSRRDALTGLHNRMAANEQLHKEFTLMRRTGNVYGLLFLDIDHFKQINDTYGHATGDQVLKAIATLLENQLRKTDFVARFGGEEFIVLLPDTALEGVVTKAEELCSSVMAHHFHQVDRVTISIGAAQSRVQDRDELDAVRRADELLYAAKRNGRNRVEA